METRIIAAVQKTGLDVYMRKTTDSWLYFTDGKNIGYMQDGSRGLSTSTVHVPNVSSGTGYQIDDFLLLSDIKRAKLERAFVFAPNWAREANSVRKFKDMAQFIEYDSFNKDYALVTPQEG